MADLLLQSVLSNLLLSSALAMIAWIVQRSGRCPFVANVLWTVVLIKMITPPFWTVELIPVDSLHAKANSTEFQLDSDLNARDQISRETSVSELEIHELSSKESERDHDSAIALAVDRDSQQSVAAKGQAKQLVNVLAIIWISVSFAIAFLVLYRMFRFNRNLKKYSLGVEPSVLNLVSDVSNKFGLPREPFVVISPANISPFCWWTGGRPEIVLSASSIEELEADELQMVIAHEVAHLKRRDHWVRLLECLVTIALWWNPVMWWARRQLRITEEMACDALVLEKMNTTGHVYAHSLLRMTELLSSSAIRPPALASAMTSGGKLEKRLKMIIKNQKPIATHWNYVVLLLLATCVFPLGLVYGQDVEAVKKRLANSVKAGEITKLQAGFMLEALELTMKMKSRDPEWRYDKEDRERAEMAKQRDKYTQIANEFKEAVERGKVTKEQAERKLEAIAKEMFGERKKSSREEQRKRREYVERETVESELAESKEKYVEFMREIETAVKKGQLSKADAERKLIAMRTKLFEGFSRKSKENKEGHENELAEKEEEFNQIYKKIEQAVKQGILSKEDAQKKLKGARLEMFGEEDQRERDGKRQEKEYSERKREYTERKWEYSQLEEQAATRERELGAKKRIYSAAVREIMNAVENEKMSKKDAERKIAELKRGLLGEADVKKAESNERAREMAKLKIQYEKAINEMERAIDAGKLSKEDARARAIELRKRLFDTRDREVFRGEKRNVEKEIANRERAWAQAVEELDKAVKSGKMSREKALEKLAALKREFQIEREVYEKDRKRREVDILGARKRKFEAAIQQLEKAVKSGKLDAAEAKEKAELLIRDLDLERKKETQEKRERRDLERKDRENPERDDEKKE